MTGKDRALTKLLARLIATISLATIATVGLFFYITYAMKAEQQRERFQSTIDNITPALGQAIYGYEDYILQQTLQILQASPEFVYARVVDDKDMLLAEKGKAPKHQVNTWHNQQLLYHTIPYLDPPDYDGKRVKVGSLEVAFSQQQLTDDLKKEIAIVAVLGLFLATGIWLITSFTIQRSINTPLKELQKAIRMAQRTHKVHQSPTASSGQVGQLIDEYNQLVMSQEARAQEQKTTEESSIRHQKLSHHQLHQKLSQHLARLQRIQIGVFEADRQGKLNYANPALAKLLGFHGVKSLMQDATPLWDFLFAERSSLTEFFKTLEKHHRLDQWSTLAANKNRTDFWALLSARQESPNLITGCVVNIDTLKQQEVAFLEAERYMGLRIQQLQKSCAGRNRQINIIAGQLANEDSLQISWLKEVHRIEVATITPSRHDIAELARAIRALLSQENGDTQKPKLVPIKIFSNIPVHADQLLMMRLLETFLHVAKTEPYTKLLENILLGMEHHANGLAIRVEFLFGSSETADAEQVLTAPIPILSLADYCVVESIVQRHHGYLWWEKAVEKVRYYFILPEPDNEG
tara:strand:- start:2237 stop:3970 length:1734 start_codon:yes stop_codon:yes gene_type:complete